MVFILVWNSKLIIPSPKSTIVVPEFFQMVFSSLNVSRERIESEPGITWYALDAMS